MYVPKRYAVEDRARLAAFVAANGFGILSTVAAGRIRSTHTPMLWLDEGAPEGCVIGHLAAANEQWRDLEGGGEVQLIFHGPHAYVSPGYYASEVNVPTWNYTAVHLRGRPRVLAERERKIGVLTALTRAHEGNDRPWRYDPDHPALAPLLAAIVCFEVRVEAVEAVFKLNQNKTRRDRESVVAHLRDSPHEAERQIAALMDADLER